MKITIDSSTVKKAMEAMLYFPGDISDEMFESIRALRTALAQPQEPDSWGAGYEAGYAAGVAERPAQPVQEPQRKPLSVTDLQDALVYTCLIDRDAIDDPEGYDTGSTVAQINALHEILTRKPT